MPKTRRALLAAAALTAALTAPAATALAALPVFRDRTIVPGRSIGGVALGSTPAKARAAWGRSGGSCSAATCDYRVAGDSSGQRGEGSFSFQPKIDRIQLKAPVGARGYVFRAPFTIPKTTSGIGIGSTVAAVKKAYPKARQVRGSNILRLAGSGRIETYFWYADDNRIFQIIIEDLGR
jgi:hypothetical protein